MEITEGDADTLRAERPRRSRFHAPWSVRGLNLLPPGQESTLSTASRTDPGPKACGFRRHHLLHRLYRRREDTGSTLEDPRPGERTGRSGREGHLGRFSAPCIGKTERVPGAGQFCEGREREPTGALTRSGRSTPPVETRVGSCQPSSRYSLLHDLLAFAPSVDARSLNAC